MNFAIRAIPAHLVEHFWKLVEPYIKRALDHAFGEFQPSDLKELCKTRDCQLWAITKGDRMVGAGITEIISYPRKKYCRIITLAGSNALEWAEMANLIVETWAREQGCVGMQAITRKGFVPKLEAIGYKYGQAILVKDF